MLNADAPDQDYWVRLVLPKVAATISDQRALDLRYAAKCARLKVREHKSAFFSFWEVVSISERAVMLADGRTITKQETISQHRAMSRPDALSFKSEAETIRRAQSLKNGF